MPRRQKTTKTVPDESTATIPLPETEPLQRPAPDTTDLLRDTTGDQDEFPTVYLMLQVRRAGDGTATVTDLSVVLKAGESVVLGRAETDVEATNHLIDLTPLDAIPLGVSRRHLTIQHDYWRLTLMDMESSNGSYLNGDRMTPLQPYKVGDGFELRLGFLLMRIFVEVEPGKNERRYWTGLPSFGDRFVWHGTILYHKGEYDITWSHLETTWTAALHLAHTHGWNPALPSLDEYQRGRMVDEDDAEALAAALEQALHDPASQAERYFEQADALPHAQALIPFCRKGGFLIGPWG